MSVANSQIGEILAIILKYVPEKDVDSLLDDLRKTEAYQRNGSYQETIDRLVKKLLERRPAWEKKV